MLKSCSSSEYAPWIGGPLTNFRIGRISARLVVVWRAVWGGPDAWWIAWTINNLVLGPKAGFLACQKLLLSWLLWYKSDLHCKTDRPYCLHLPACVSIFVYFSLCLCKHCLRRSHLVWINFVGIVNGQNQPRVPCLRFSVSSHVVAGTHCVSMKVVSSGCAERSIKMCSVS